MNSMYGRFGMHTDMTQTKIVPYSEKVELGKHFTIQSSIQLGSFYLVNYILENPPLAAPLEANKLVKQYFKGLPGRTNVAIASAVTAYSRMIINSYKLKALELDLKIYYSDTDSLVTNRELPSDLIDSAELGKLKLEHTITEGIFVMPKIYYLKTTEDKEVVKTKQRHLEFIEKNEDREYSMLFIFNCNVIDLNKSVP